MGILEEESRKKAKRENIQKIVLGTIKGVGLLSVGLLAPNVIGAMSKLGIIEKSRKYRVNRSIDGLISKGLIKLEKTERGTFVLLTKKGEILIERLYNRGRLSRPQKWDRKWRVVVYDLSEKKRILREKLRNTLVSFGFLRLQDSVWIYPYDCEDLINLVKADFKIGKEILYMIVERVENDSWLKNEFEIK